MEEQTRGGTCPVPRPGALRPQAGGAIPRRFNGGSEGAGPERAGPSPPELPSAHRSSTVTAAPRVRPRGHRSSDSAQPRSQHGGRPRPPGGSPRPHPLLGPDRRRAPGDAAGGEPRQPGRGWGLRPRPRSPPPPGRGGAGGSPPVRPPPPPAHTHPPTSRPSGPLPARRRLSPRRGGAGRGGPRAAAGPWSWQPPARLPPCRPRRSAAAREPHRTASGRALPRAATGASAAKVPRGAERFPLGAGGGRRPRGAAPRAAPLPTARPGPGCHGPPTALRHLQG